MTVRLAIPTDAQALADMANAQRLLIEAIFGPRDPWTLDFAQKVIARDRAVYVYENPTIQAFMRVVDAEWGEHGVGFWLSQAGSLTQRIARFKRAIREFAPAWFPAAAARGAPLCTFHWKDSERSFSRTAGWDKLGQFGTQVVDENGMRWWYVTPQQGLDGAATV